MGQDNSKRPMPSIQVQSLQTAHLPEKPRTPTPSKALLNVPKQHIRWSGQLRNFGVSSQFFRQNRIMNITLAIIKVGD